MRILSILAGVLTLFTLNAVPAHVIHPVSDVQIDIITDEGRVLPLHHLNGSHTNEYRAYLEAVHGKNYGIRIHNRTGNRIGLVIAVDGRNIISGSKSFLKPSERMYILGPYEQGKFDGWRTSTEKISRFYFTDAGDSYAGAWDDYTAMGVIAVAVFPEKKYLRPLPHREGKSSLKREQREVPSQAPPGRANEETAGIYADSDSRPGTGFGDEEYSHVRVVHFDPVSTPSSRYFFKYEWRETLCDKGIINCSVPRPYNRFWPDEGQAGFAPHPPG